MSYSEKKQKAFHLFIVWLIATVSLISATLAWMGISTTPTVTDLSLTVITDSELLLATDKDGDPDEETWSTILDMGLDDKEVVLMPVTFIASEKKFYMPKYGVDGRVENIYGYPLTDEDGHILSDVLAENTENSCLYSFDFWVKSNSSDCIVTLSPPINRETDILGGGTFFVGEPIWDEELIQHSDLGNGAENAMRMAIRVDDTDDKGNITDSVIVLYEPNADSSGEVLETFSGDDSVGLLQGDFKLIQQSVSTWEENSPVLKDKVVYKPGEFLTDDLELFELKNGSVKHCILYVWLEGQDADCTNKISMGKTFGNIQFSVKPNNSSNTLKPE